jgi:hypothetical protein
MIPTSDQMEDFAQRLRNLHTDLGKLKGAEVTKAETITEIKAIAKEWLRLSEALRNANAIPPENLAPIDEAIRLVLESTNSRTRSSSYRKKVQPILSSFTEKVVIPAIRFEGSPVQVAGRKLIAKFEGKVTSDEQAYVEEASKCLTSKCNRAAIIMLWAAGMARFHGAIERLGFNSYNTALTETVKKKGPPFNKVSNTPIGSLPELQRSRDFDLLVVGMSLWKYDLQVFEELERLLGVRNSAAHPGMATPVTLDGQQYASKVAKYIFALVPL